MPSELCDSCNSIFARLERPLDEDLFPHHTNEASFWAAVGSGCLMCCALSREFNLSAERRLRHPHNFRNRLKYSFTGDLGDANIGHFEVTLYFVEYIAPGEAVQDQDQSSTKPIGISKARFWMSPSDDPTTVSTTPLFGADTSSREAMNMATSWIKSCKSSHKSCSPSSDLPAFYPTRLIDLDPGLGHKDLIRVVEPQKATVEQPYMTLSHRWGTHQFPMFTEANRPSMTEGFSSTTLPQAFQDAIHVTRRFGIRYLWIDCLCILQGSAEDFEKEAGLMHRVYGHSYCNICATGARDNHEALFAQRMVSDGAQIEIKLAWQSKTSKQYVLFDAQLWKHAVFSRPVNQRAWVMQERFLAPCVLHFGTNQILWECRQLHACEQFPSGLPAAISFGAYDLKTIDLPREADLDMSPELRVYKLWCVLLHAYTRCGLTQARDKLIALAGIANRVRETLRDEYLAGLWKSWLMYDLCWQVDFASQTTAPERPSFYRAPSWSWASLDGPINLGGSVPIHPSAALICEILAASAVPTAESNPFGGVKAANLVLQGQLDRLLAMPDTLITSVPAVWHRMARAGVARFAVNGVPLPRMGMAINFDDASAHPPATDLWCCAVRREDHESEEYLSENEHDRSEALSGLRQASSGSDLVESQLPPARTDPFIFGLVLVGAPFNQESLDQEASDHDASQGTPRGTEAYEHQTSDRLVKCFRRVGYFTLGGNDVVDAYETACSSQRSTLRLI